jgi:hypothetical protein
VVQWCFQRFGKEISGEFAAILENIYDRETVAYVEMFDKKTRVRTCRETFPLLSEFLKINFFSSHFSRSLSSPIL